MILSLFLNQSIKRISRVKKKKNWTLMIKALSLLYYDYKLKAPAICITLSV